MSYPMSIKAIRSGLALTLLCTTATISNPAFAQVSAPFIGSWKAAWQSDKRSYDALMNVTEKGGTWQTYVRNQNNPCAGREVPMKVESAAPTEVKFVLQFSETIPGCPNATVTLKAAPDGTVTGMRSKFDLTLARQ